MQGTPDTLFAWATVVLCWLICLLVSSLKWPNSGYVFIIRSNYFIVGTNSKVFFGCLTYLITCGTQDCFI